MSRVLFFLALAVVCANALFFGCTMRPATGTVVTNGGGHIACTSGLFDGVNTMACEFKFWNLNTVPTLTHFHVGTDATASGLVTFTFDVTQFNSNVNGSAYQIFQASQTTGAPSWQQQSTTSFDDQVTICSNNGCYFNLHTSTYTGGELRCELQILSPTYSYVNVPLVAAPGSTGAVVNANASVWMAEILPSSTPKRHAWGYYVSFDLGAHTISNAHIHQGTSLTDNAGPVKVQFNWGLSRSSGSFVGVALEGVLGADQSASNWPAYTADFDTAIANHFCYINLHTPANPSGEVRANISPVNSGSGSTGGGGGSTNSASSVSMTVFGIVAVVAASLAL